MFFHKKTRARNSSSVPRKGAHWLSSKYSASLWDLCPLLRTRRPHILNSDEDVGVGPGLVIADTGLCLEIGVGFEDCLETGVGFGHF